MAKNLTKLYAAFRSGYLGDKKFRILGVKGVRKMHLEICQVTNCL